MAERQLKVISGTFGNNREGQIYKWITELNVRTGQRHVAPAFNIPANRVINTLITVRATTTKVGSTVMDLLNGKDINLRWLEDASVGSIRELPGYQPNSWDWSGGRNEFDARETTFRLVTRDGQQFAEPRGTRVGERIGRAYS